MEVRIMVLATRSVFEEMDRLRRELDDFLGGGVGLRWDLPFSKISFLPGRAARSYPLVNVEEADDRFTVEALAPGLDPSTLQLSFHDNTLTVSGEKETVTEESESDRIHRLERSGGRFLRTVRLTREIDRDRIEAEYKDGILRVSLPKAEAARPRSIDVRVH